MTLEYQEQIDKFFNALYPSWMCEDEKAVFKKEIEIETGITEKKMNDDIKTGVKNGISADLQVKLAIAMIRDN